MPPGAKENDSKINYHPGCLTLFEFIICVIMNTTTNKGYDVISLRTTGQDDVFLGEKRVQHREIFKQIFFFFFFFRRGGGGGVVQRFFVPGLCLMQISPSQDFRSRKHVTRCPRLYCLLGP